MSIKKSVEKKIEKNRKYLELLTKQFPNVKAASTEIINLQAILNLPKGTEHFLSDIHGEDEAFLHVLNNGSGVVRKKIEDVFGTTLRQAEKRSLATLIYYPKEILDNIDVTEEDLEDWYEITLHRLVLICREVSSKYTRSKVRKALPKDFDYIIEELLHEQENDPNKFEYYDVIIKTIIQTDQAKPFIVSISKLIQRLAIDRLHIIGDIYDRGPGAEIIMDRLIDYHSLDIQWGNHDIGWIGASAGALICIAHVIRVTAKYGNLHTLEEGYGINLIPLAKFAMEIYDDISVQFKPDNVEKIEAHEMRMVCQMHKAISIIQFKLEGQLIERHPEYKMEDRLLLNHINYEEGTIHLQGKEYKLIDHDFPTIDSENPYELTTNEQDVILKLRESFLRNEKLQKHVDLLLVKGGIYSTFNGNLLYHGCIPMDEKGGFVSMEIDGQLYSGKSLLDQFDRKVREIYGSRFHEKDQYHLDLFWYLISGSNSSLFGKDKMTTFERYFLKEEELYKEQKNPYYQYITQEETCNRILQEFGLNNQHSKIINGHVPVKVSKGESPIKANGRLLVIDGGFSKAYQKLTGIAGYTLIYNSHGMILAAHEPFESKQKALEEDKDIISNLTMLDQRLQRIRVRNTDIGVEIQSQIKDLELLLLAYKNGLIAQK